MSMQGSAMMYVTAPQSTDAKRPSTVSFNRSSRADFASTWSKPAVCARRSPSVSVWFVKPRIGDEFYATQGHCLHLQGPLCEGRLRGTVLSCPWHGWQYDVRTGENEFDRAIQLETYEVRVEDGEVKVAV